ncbi:hypothetical protein QN366_01510 [Pseudomonas sp. CCC3.2]|uniref:hypothetical protein n=1 Tax=unclassified Pseudomonas TaxID=196821 RepID=UPI002AB516CB|nr:MULTISPECIES: hypothetical protein [unclassified Pseudomonas]MDY7560198.1 hypothetical protein [Pseudomonas sp. AB6]MEB0178747.1 hypothetical protein [Pseudomonas sp. CCC3.2]MEB0211385.1 hypothetical protein [Pseudomonas sp. AB6]
MDNFIMEAGGHELDESFRPLIEIMQSLKELPEFPFDVFYSLITDGLDDLAISLDSTALSTGDLRAVVRPGRRIELITTALLALKLYLHR